MKDLDSMGYDKYGLETLVYKGTRMKEPVFVAPGYYYILKHMVAEKAGVRGFGSRPYSTGAPPRGTKAGGASRFGTQEKSVCAAHSAAFLYREILLQKADPKTMYMLSLIHI